MTPHQFIQRCLREKWQSHNSLLLTCTIGVIKKPRYKLGSYSRVAANLYRYSSTKKYYAVFKCSGKTKWIPLETADRELATRKLKEEIAKFKKTDPKASTMTLATLLEIYLQSIQGRAMHTQATRKSIASKFRESWKHGFETPVRAITKGQLRLWLSEQQARLKKSSFNEYMRFIRHLFALALEHKMIAESPASDLKQVKIATHIRTHPSWDQFLAPVSSAPSSEARPRGAWPDIPARNSRRASVPPCARATREARKARTS